MKLITQEELQKRLNEELLSTLLDKGYIEYIDDIKTLYVEHPEIIKAEWDNIVATNFEADMRAALAHSIN